ncbi:hypothetical protein HK101_002904, partial [Irineochytrium annulatum]
MPKSHGIAPEDTTSTRPRRKGPRLLSGLTSPASPQPASVLESRDSRSKAEALPGPLHHRRTGSGGGGEPANAWTAIAGHESAGEEEAMLSDQSDNELQEEPFAVPPPPLSSQPTALITAAKGQVGPGARDKDAAAGVVVSTVTTTAPARRSSLHWTALDLAQVQAIVGAVEGGAGKSLVDLLEEDATEDARYAGGPATNKDDIPSAAEVYQHDTKVPDAGVKEVDEEGFGPVPIFPMQDMERVETPLASVQRLDTTYVLPDVAMSPFTPTSMLPVTGMLLAVDANSTATAVADSDKQVTDTEDGGRTEEGADSRRPSAEDASSRHPPGGDAMRRRPSAVSTASRETSGTAVSEGAALSEKSYKANFPKVPERKPFKPPKQKLLTSLTNDSASPAPSPLPSPSPSPFPAIPSPQLSRQSSGTLVGYTGSMLRARSAPGSDASHRQRATEELATGTLSVDRPAARRLKPQISSPSPISPSTHRRSSLLAASQHSPGDHDKAFPTPPRSLDDIDMSRFEPITSSSEEELEQLQAPVTPTFGLRTSSTKTPEQPFKRGRKGREGSISSSAGSSVSDGAVISKDPERDQLRKDRRPSQNARPPLSPQLEVSGARGRSGSDGAMTKTAFWHQHIMPSVVYPVTIERPSASARRPSADVGRTGLTGIQFPGRLDSLPRTDTPAPAATYPRARAPSGNLAVNTALDPVAPPRHRSAGPRTAPPISLGQPLSSAKPRRPSHIPSSNDILSPSPQYVTSGPRHGHASHAGAAKDDALHQHGSTGLPAASMSLGRHPDQQRHDRRQNGTPPVAPASFRIRSAKVRNSVTLTLTRGNHQSTPSQLQGLEVVGTTEGGRIRVMEERGLVVEAMSPVANGVAPLDAEGDVEEAEKRRLLELHRVQVLERSLAEEGLEDGGGGGDACRKELHPHGSWAAAANGGAVEHHEKGTPKWFKRAFAKGGGGKR